MGADGRTAGLYRVKVVPALYPHGSSLSQLTKTNQTSPHLGALGQKLGSPSLIVKAESTGIIC